MRRTPKKKRTQKFSIRGKRLFFILTLIGALVSIVGILFLGSVMIRIIKPLLSSKPIKTIKEFLTLVFEILITATTLNTWFSFKLPPFWIHVINTIKNHIRKHTKKYFVPVVLVIMSFPLFNALDKFEFAQSMIAIEQDILSAFKKVLDNTSLDSGNTENSIENPNAVISHSTQFVITSDPYQYITEDQRNRLFYIGTIDWYDLDSALHRHTFYVVERQLLDGIFPNLVSTVHEEVQNRLAQQSNLSPQCLTARVPTLDGNSECSLLDAMEACDNWNKEYSYSTSLEVCLEHHKYIQQLYSDFPCDRLARLYADACYQVQDRLSKLSAQTVTEEVFLYYIAEEIAAYEEIYRQEPDRQTFKELVGAYGRIEASGLVNSGDRLKAWALKNTDLPDFVESAV